MVRQGIELGLGEASDIKVIGSFGTGSQLLEALARQLADVVVMDFVLAPSDIDGELASGIEQTFQPVPAVDCGVALHSCDRCIVVEGGVLGDSG